MREVEVTVPPKHVRWFVMERTFPVIVELGEDHAKLGDHQYALYKAPDRGLHVKRKGGPVLGTITERGIVGAITEEAAKDLKALRAAYFEVNYEFVVAHQFAIQVGTKTRKRHTHPRCSEAYGQRHPTVTAKPQFYLKGTPDCAHCGGSIE